MMTDNSSSMGSQSQARILEQTLREQKKLEADLRRQLAEAEADKVHLRSKVSIFAASFIKLEGERDRLREALATVAVLAQKGYYHRIKSRIDKALEVKDES